MNCKHCHKEIKYHDERGMCKRCVGQPIIPIPAHLDHESERPDPNESTDALPGSDEKIKILRRRVENFESLFHEDDENGLEPGFSKEVLYYSSKPLDCRVNRDHIGQI